MRILNFFTLASFAITFVALRAFGQDVQPPSGQEITQFLALLSGVGGLKGAALIALVIQGLMLFFRSGLANFAGKWRLAVVLGLSFVGSFVGVIATGKPWTAAILDGAVIAAFQVFANQMWKQFATDKGNETKSGLINLK